MGIRPPWKSLLACLGRSISFNDINNLGVYRDSGVNRRVWAKGGFLRLVGRLGLTLGKPGNHNRWGRSVQLRAQKPRPARQQNQYRCQNVLPHNNPLPEVWWQGSNVGHRFGMTEVASPEIELSAARDYKSSLNLFGTHGCIICSVLERKKFKWNEATS